MIPLLFKFFFIEKLVYSFLVFLPNIAKPRRPEPKRSRVEGSGTCCVFHVTSFEPGFPSASVS
jgi:hypothetical protein